MMEHKAENSNQTKNKNRLFQLVFKFPVSSIYIPTYLQLAYLILPWIQGNME